MLCACNECATYFGLKAERPVKDSRLPPNHLLGRPQTGDEAEFLKPPRERFHDCSQAHHPPIHILLNMIQCIMQGEVGG